jgi:leucyl-tRNA synthetase
MGPPEQDAAWNENALAGSNRLLSRIWNAAQELESAGADLRANPDVYSLETPTGAQGDSLTLIRKAHWAIDRVTNEFTGRFGFHNSISAVTELVNDIYRYPQASAESRLFAVATAVSLMFPFSPHMTSEVFEQLTGRRVWEEPWPSADPELLVADSFELVCQVNGKVRARVDAPSDASREALEELALATAGVKQHLNGHEVVKVVVVPGKLVNVVVR